MTAKQHYLWEVIKTIKDQNQIPTKITITVQKYIKYRTDITSKLHSRN